MLLTHLCLFQFLGGASPAGAVVASGHSPYYSEFSEYAMEGGKLTQRYPWGKKKSVNKQDDQDIMDILSCIMDKLQ